MTTLHRRSFLSGAAATAATGLVAAGPVPLATAATAARRNGVVDAHAHLLPGWWRATLPGGVSAGVPAPRWSPRRAVRHMDRHGVAVQVLSLPDPVVTHLPDAAGRLAAAQRANDELAALTSSSAYAGRFLGLATVPLGPDPTPAEVLTAVTEVQRALGLGLVGVSLLSNYGGTYLGNPTLTPLMQALHVLGATVQVQGSVEGAQPRTDVPPFLLEAAFNSTRAAVSMSYLQVFTTTPGITWLFADAGGSLPYLAYRSSLLEVYPAVAQNLGLGDLDDQNFDYGRLWYDTAHTNTLASSPALRSVREVAPVSQVVLGTDYPFARRDLDRSGMAASVRTVFSDAEARAITRTNAAGLFPALA